MAKGREHKGHTHCIFCGGAGISAEHIFPDWLGKDFPNPPRAKRLDLSWRLEQHGSPGRIYERQGLKNGMARNFRVRAVCKLCNNGWMSEIENQAKPLLNLLMHGNAWTIREYEQSILMTWLVLKAMVFDGYGGPDELIISRQDREQFRKSFFVKPEWRAWIGRSHVKAGVNAPYLGKSFLSCPEDDFEQKPVVLRRNTLHVQITMGNLLLLFIASESKLVPSLKLTQRTAFYLRQLHPAPGQDLPWAFVPDTPHEVSQQLLDWTRHVRFGDAKKN